MWLSDVKIVLPDKTLEHGSLLVEDGLIVDIIEGSAPADVPSLHGLTLIPGLIDLHGDMLERDVQPRPSARFPTEMGLIELDKRLAGSGITTAYAAISFAWRNTDLRSQESATEMIRTLNHLNDETLVDMYVHARFEVTNPDTGPILSELLKQKLVQLVSIMDHPPGQGQYADVDRYLTFMHKWLGVDIESLGTSRDEIMKKMKANIVAEAEKPRDWDVVRDVIDVALQYNVPIASHDDDTAEKVIAQADMGVSISEFPVTEEAARTAKERGMWVIMGAPNLVRGGSHKGNASALEMAAMGLIDALASDYHYPSLKRAAFLLADGGVCDLASAWRLVSLGPAQILGLEDRGELRPGLRADLTVIDTATRRIMATMAGGRISYMNGAVAARFIG